MADDKQGRVAQAHNAERRQWEREIEEARSRIDESEPTDEGADEEVGGFRPCHRSGCERTAMFYVLERYEEEVGNSVVKETANLCRQHSAEERPMHLDGVYDNYVFSIEQLPELTVLDESES